MTIQEQIAKRTESRNELQQKIELVDRNVALLQQQRAQLLEQYLREDGAIAALTDLANEAKAQPEA